MILSFAFRQDPSYFAMDDVYVVDTVTGLTVNSDPSFESGTLNCCTLCNPSGSSAGGQISSSYALTGTFNYYDGAVGNPDYLILTLTVVPGRTYTISFWLRNLGGPTNSITILVDS